MESKYRLKKEARQFFDKKYHDKINNLKQWNSYGIPIQVLNEVERVYIDYGHDRLSEKGDVKSSSLSGWESKQKDSDGQAHYCFTVKVQDISRVTNEKVEACKLLDEIQKVLNKYFKHI